MLLSALRRTTVYAALDADGTRHWRWTLRPLVDAEYWRRRGARLMVPLQPTMPAMWADLACRTAERMQRSATSKDQPVLTEPVHPLWRRLVRRLRRPDMVARLDRRLRLSGYEVGVRADDAILLSDSDTTQHTESSHRTSAPQKTDVAAVRDLLRGRLLTVREIERLVERENVSLGRPVVDCLAWLEAAGHVRQLPGIRRGPFGTLRCMRCGEAEALHAWDCAICGERECWQCEACRSMGAVRSCTVLYATEAACETVEGGVDETDGRLGGRPVTVHAPQLTAAQQRASDALTTFVRPEAPEPRDAVVWAVCGAGKTEMSFAAVATVLSRGGRVLFAIPRRDVVRELGRRLRRAFPDVELQVLHGGTDRTALPVLSPGSLTVATTH